MIKARLVLQRKLRKDSGIVKFRAFPKCVTPRIVSLESVDYFGTSEHYLVLEKKNKNLN